MENKVAQFFVKHITKLFLASAALTMAGLALGV